MAKKSIDLPLVSIVIPTFNRSALLQEAIRSVLHQTLQDFELIIVNDGSNDDTREVVEQLAQSDGRVKYFYQENAGQSSARNLGISYSKGKYIAFLDSDNIWLPERLKLGMDYLAETEAALCFGDLISVDLQGKEIRRSNMRRFSGDVFSKMIVDNFVSMNTVLVKKSCLPSDRPFNEKNKLDEDYELWLSLASKYKFIYIPEYLALYRTEGTDRISSSFIDRLDANEATILKFVTPEMLRQKEIRDSFRAFYCRKIYALGKNNLILIALHNVFRATYRTGVSIHPLKAWIRSILSQLKPQ